MDKQNQSATSTKEIANDPTQQQISGKNIAGMNRDEFADMAGNNNIDFILDIPLEITVELGRTRMMICDLLKLGQGSVIELSKLAGDTLEILANNKLIAKGEVVVMNEKYGIRLTEVSSPVERIEKLR
ncbi:MAG: flagellar motor switch protein FliN [Desulfobacteraceae bacterium]|nr:flagellar motor switch protein FliN [Desulfobacteraceae bacterium]MBU4054955.1 flagellar motor switch protein FliN [Pseudomonadota bacterium]